MALKIRNSVDVKNNLALKRLDINNDGKVDKKDFPKMSDAQIEGALAAATALADPGIAPVEDGFSLEGKKVVFTSLEDLSKADAKRLAKDAGAAVRSGISGQTDVLVVGDADGTSKDERAIQMNATGLASIRLMSETDFRKVTATTSSTAPDLGIAGSGSTVTITDEFLNPFKVKQGVIDKVLAAMEESAWELWDAFGEDSGFLSAEEARDSIGDLSDLSLYSSDDTSVDFSMYGAGGAFFVEVDKASGDINDAYHHD